jgi:hypothetical protein
MPDASYPASASESLSASRAGVPCRSQYYPLVLKEASSRLLTSGDLDRLIFTDGERDSRMRFSRERKTLTCASSKLHVCAAPSESVIYQTATFPPFPKMAGGLWGCNNVTRGSISPDGVLARDRWRARRSSRPEPIRSCRWSCFSSWEPPATTHCLGSRHEWPSASLRSNAVASESHPVPGAQHSNVVPRVLPPGRA